jgi:hypothetical protein
MMENSLKLQQEWLNEKVEHLDEMGLEPISFPVHEMLIFVSS